MAGSQQRRRLPAPSHLAQFAGDFAGGGRGRLLRSRIPRCERILAQHGLITVTNCFAQHLRRRSEGDSWMMFTSRAVARGRSMSYYVVGVAPGPASEQRLVAIGA